MQVNALRQARPLVAITGEATFLSPHLSRLSSHFGAAIAWRALPNTQQSVKVSMSKA